MKFLVAAISLALLHGVLAINVHDFPKTSFSCKDKQSGEYYADTELSCQVYHICAQGQFGRLTKMSFACPNGTIFSQSSRICNTEDRVHCPLSERYFDNVQGTIDTMGDYSKTFHAGQPAFPLEVPQQAQRRPAQRDDDYEDDPTTQAPRRQQNRRQPQSRTTTTTRAPPPPPPRQSRPPVRQFQPPVLQQFEAPQQQEFPRPPPGQFLPPRQTVRQQQQQQGQQHQQQQQQIQQQQHARPQQSVTNSPVQYATPQRPLGPQISQQFLPPAIPQPPPQQNLPLPGPPPARPPIPTNAIPSSGNPSGQTPAPPTNRLTVNRPTQLRRPSPLSSATTTTTAAPTTLDPNVEYEYYDYEEPADGQQPANQKTQ